MRKWAALASMMALFVLPALTASASQPTTNTEYPWDFEHDFQNDLIYFWNVTKEAYCDWADSGFPPGGPAGVEPVEVTTIEFGDTNFIWKYQATAPIEIWTNTHTGETCDPDDELFATGTATQTQRNITNDTVGYFQSNRQGQGVVIEEGTTNRFLYSWTSLGTNTGPIKQQFNLQLMGG